MKANRTAILQMYLSRIEKTTQISAIKNFGARFTYTFFYRFIPRLKLEKRNYRYAMHFTDEILDA